VVKIAKKIAKKDGVNYICEKCDNEMFKFLVKAKGKAYHTKKLLPA